METDAPETHGVAASEDGAPGEGASVVAGRGASSGGVGGLEAFFAGLPEVGGVADVMRPEDEGALRASRALFDVTLSTIGDFVYTFDRDGRILFANQPLLDLWGIELADAVGKTFHGLGYPPALADRHRREIEHVFETGEGLTNESVYAGASGEERTYEYIFRPLQAGDGTVSLVVGSTRDVTARRRAERTLEAEARRATFRATLADALRSVSDPVEVQAQAARTLGEHLGASRVHYAELEPDGVTAVVARDEARGVPDGSGRYDLSDYPALLADARAGRTLIVDDVQTSERLGAAERERFAGLRVAAIVVVPFVKDDRLVAVLAVHHDAPHAWAGAEVALVEETAERTRAAVARARAEADLRASEERLHLALEASAIGTHTYDVATDRHMLDARACEISGLGADVPLGGWADRVHGDDRDRVAAAAERALDPEGDGVFDEEYRLVRPGGAVRWVYVRSRTAFEGGTGSAAGRRAVRVAGTIQDVTERKRTEQALRESEDRLRKVAETVPDVLFRTTASGTVDFVNGAFQTFTGRPPEAVIGAEIWHGLVHEDDLEATRAAWAEAHASEERFEVRHRLAASDGWCWVITRARPFHDVEGDLEAWFGTLTDVDALTRAEGEVRQLNATLGERVAERTEQVRELSARLTTAEEEERQRIVLVLHDDLQQQLAGLGMILNVLWRSPASDEERALQARATEIVDGASALTRSLAGEMSPPSLASPDFAETVRWLADRKREEHALEVAVEAGACEVPDRGVRAMLYRTLRELLFNVVKHAGTGRATVRARRDGADVVVEVEDDGAGFDTAARTASGGGLGLFSVRERIERAGGRLDLDAEPGRGTRVTVTVPAGR